MSNVYVVMGNRSPVGWRIISAWCSERLATESAEEVMRAIESRNSTMLRSSKWRFWEKATRAVLCPAMPVEFRMVWRANSVGGGNSWSNIAVAKLIVQGTLLDELAEV